MNYNALYIDPAFEEIREEKRKIRFAGNAVGFAFLMLTSIMIFWSIPVKTFIDSVFKNPHKVYVILSDPAVSQVIQIVVSSIAFIVPFLIFMKIMKSRMSEVGAYNKPKEKNLVIPYVLFGLGVCGLANVLSSLMGGVFQSIFNLFDYKYALGVRALPEGPFGMALSFIATAVTPALVEEFALRGAVMGSLKKYGEGFAIVTSSVVFGLMHGNLAQIPFAFVLGLYFGYAAIKTGTIWTAVIIHFLNNFFTVIYSYGTESVDVFFLWFFKIFYIIALFIFGFIGLFMLSKRKQTNFKVDNNVGKLSQTNKFLVFFTAPVMIASYVAVIVETFYVYAV